MKTAVMIIGLAMMAIGLCALGAPTFQQVMTGLAVFIAGVAVVINTGPIARATQPKETGHD